MAFFKQKPPAIFQLFVSFLCPVSTSPAGANSLAARDDRSEATRILNSLGAIATAFCSNYLHLKDATVTALDPGSTAYAYVTVPGVAPSVTAPGGTSTEVTTTTVNGALVTTIITQPGDVVHVSITPSPKVLQQTQNLPATTVTSTVTLSALTSTVHVTNGGLTNPRTSINPVATITVDITDSPVTITQGTVTTIATTTTVSTSTVFSTNTVTSTAYTFKAAAKRAATSSIKQAAAPSSRMDKLAGLEKLAAPYVSSACSQIARTTTKTVTSRGANIVQTMTQTAVAKTVTITAPAVRATQIVTMSNPGATVTLSTHLPALTDVMTLMPGVVTVVVTTQLPAVTVTVNTQLTNVFQTQTVQLLDATSYVFVDQPVVIISHTVAPPAITITTTATSTSTASATYTTTSTKITTIIATITNPPGACQQTVYTSLRGYGLLGEGHQQDVSAANTVECCQKCFMTLECQIYAYFPPGEGSTQCSLYSNGSNGNGQQPDMSLTCPAGIIHMKNDGQTNPDPSRYALNYQGPGPCAVLGA